MTNVDMDGRGLKLQCRHSLCHSCLPSNGNPSSCPSSSSTFSTSSTIGLGFASVSSLSASFSCPSSAFSSFPSMGESSSSSSARSSSIRSASMPGTFKVFALSRAWCPAWYSSHSLSVTTCKNSCASCCCLLILVRKAYSSDCTNSCAEMVFFTMGRSLSLSSMSFKACVTMPDRRPSSFHSLISALLPVPSASSDVILYISGPSSFRRWSSRMRYFLKSGSPASACNTEFMKQSAPRY